MIETRTESLRLLKAAPFSPPSAASQNAFSRLFPSGPVKIVERRDRVSQRRVVSTAVQLFYAESTAMRLVVISREYRKSSSEISLFPV